MSQRLATAPFDDSLARQRHSLAHVLAQAVLELYPGTKLGFGPATDEGFFYDFEFPQPIAPQDLPAIEERMRSILQTGAAFIRQELEPDAGLRHLSATEQPFKQEFAQEILARGSPHICFYRSGSFVDMCEGPHVPTMNEIAASGFRLRNISGAYWRGDVTKAKMTRISAWAFASTDELVAHLAAHERAKERDHKKLGRELELFAFDDDVGKGLPLWLPNGTALRDELEKLMRELEFEEGYQRVATPHLAKRRLYEKTGHLPYYAPHMFPFLHMGSAADAGTRLASPAAERSEEDCCLRPMNCPHHHKIFASRKRSYRELPLRLAEHGTLYRYEDSGALSGLLRVRQMTMNDAHIYCTRDQVKDECRAVLDLHDRVYAVLGLSAYRLRLSTRAAEGDSAASKFVDVPAAWEESETILRELLQERAQPFEEGVGEGAFYGPKIDFQFQTVSGREETASTLQIDFVVPERLCLRYIDEQGHEQCPYVLHRAPLGTHERFVALLVEHFGGRFPLWLSPVQVRIIPVSEMFLPYAKRVLRDLRKRGIRAEVDPHDETVGKKVRSAAISKIPHVLVLGAREEQHQSVTLRRRGERTSMEQPLAEYAAETTESIALRRANGSE